MSSPPIHPRNSSPLTYLSPDLPLLFMAETYLLILTENWSASVGKADAPVMVGPIQFVDIHRWPFHCLCSSFACQLLFCILEVLRPHEHGRGLCSYMVCLWGNSVEPRLWPLRSHVGHLFHIDVVGQVRLLAYVTAHDSGISVVSSLSGVHPQSVRVVSGFARFTRIDLLTEYTEYDKAWL